MTLGDPIWSRIFRVKEFLLTELVYWLILTILIQALWSFDLPRTVTSGSIFLMLVRSATSAILFVALGILCTLVMVSWKRKMLFAYIVVGTGISFSLWTLVTAIGNP